MIMHIQSFEGVTEKDFLVSWPAPNRHSHPEAYDESGDKSMRRQAYKNAQVQQIRFFRKVRVTCPFQIEDLCNNLFSLSEWFPPNWKNKILRVPPQSCSHLPFNLSGERFGLC
jgi:hypothetical protein